MVNKAHHCAEESVRQYFDTDASLIQTDLLEIASWEEELRSAAHAPDKSRLLMILAASSQSRSKLNVVLPRLLMQATEAQMSADMIVGLDRGTVYHMVTTIPGLVSCVREIRVGVEGCLNCISDPSGPGHRLFVIEPNDGIHANGKNGVLRSVADLIDESILSGSWESPPSLTLQCDDDTWLYREAAYSSNGLQALLAELRAKSFDLLGARWNNVQYVTVPRTHDTATFPGPMYPGSEAHQWIDESQHSWYRFMPGGATLGDTFTMSAIRRTIGHTYIGATSDDILTTMFADTLGKKWGIAHKAYTFNEARDPNTQIKRWLQGTFSLRSRLGRTNFSGLYTSLTLPPVLRSMPRHHLDTLIAQNISARHDLTKPASWT